MNKASINRLKICIIVLFVFPAVFFFFDKHLEKKVSGQNGGVNLSAPTDVTATDGIYSTKVGLRWNTMRGATGYRIFRGISADPAAALDLGTTPENSFFDTTVPQGQTFFYWVRSENTSETSSLSQAEQGFRANGILGNGTQPLEPPNAPAGNPITATKASLGKALFWDEQLSSTRTVACGTCHSGAGGGVDKRTFTQRTRSTNPGFNGLFNDADDVFGSAGVIANNLDGTFNWSNTFGFREQVTGRRAMPYTDAAYPDLLFSDGRATGTFRDPLTNQVILQNGGALESQVLGPPVSDVEMAHSGRNWQQVADRIRDVKPLAVAVNIPTGLQNWIDGRTYAELFEEAFGTPEVTPARIAMAIATHERTLFSDQTPFDQVNQGIGTLTVAERNGNNLFEAASCSACHSGSLLTDDAFHYIGVRPSNEDIGRQQVTGNENESAQFRTPNLRNVQLRGAYFHNGNFTTLRQVVDFYDRGGDFDAPNKNGNVRPLSLSNQQINDIVAFMSRPLTDPRVRDELPPFDHPTLYTESNRVPQISGTGRAGTGNIIPQVHAIEPPLAGNPSFTVGVANALGGAQGVLVINSSDPGVGNSIPASGSFTRQTVLLAGGGYGSVSLSIPNDPQIVGQTFFGRWYITDASAANGFSVSQLFQFTVFGEVIQTPTGIVSGKVTYANALTSTAVPFTTLNAAGSLPLSIMTDANGDYSLSGFVAGAYTVTPSKTNQVNGISNLDASRVAQHIVGLTVLDANQQIAADTSGNGTIGSLDAAYIAQFIASITNPGITGRWKFLPASRSYPNVLTNQTGQDYSAILVGDVTGNWNPAGALRFDLSAGSDSTTQEEKAAQVEGVKVIAQANELVAEEMAMTLNLTATETTGEGILGYQFDLFYDPTVIEPQAVGCDVTETLSNGMTAICHASESGVLKVVLFGATPMSGTGTLLKLNFKLIGAKNSTPAFNIKNFMFNEGLPNAVTVKGQW